MNRRIRKGLGGLILVVGLMGGSLGAEEMGEKQGRWMVESYVGGQSGGSTMRGVGAARQWQRGEGAWAWRLVAQGQWRRGKAPAHYRFREWGMRPGIEVAWRGGDRWEWSGRLSPEIRGRYWAPQEGESTMRVTLDGPVVAMAIGRQWRERWQIRLGFENWRQSEGDGEWGYWRWRWGGWLGVVRWF